MVIPDSNKNAYLFKTVQNIIFHPAMIKKIVSVCNHTSTAFFRRLYFLFKMLQYVTNLWDMIHQWNNRKKNQIKKAFWFNLFHASILNYFDFLWKRKNPKAKFYYHFVYLIFCTCWNLIKCVKFKLLLS